MHEQALEYLTAPEQGDAYAGMLEALAVAAAGGLACGSRRRKVRRREPCLASTMIRLPGMVRVVVVKVVVVTVLQVSGQRPRRPRRRRLKASRYVRHSRGDRHSEI